MREARPRAWLRALAWMAALGTIVILALWVLVGDTRWTSVINLGTFWWSLAAVPAVLMALVLSDRRAAALFLIPAAVWIWSYGGAFLPPAEVAGPADLRVTSFNTFVQVEGVEHVLRVVEEADPDILLLQEVFPEREEQLRTHLADRLPHVHVDQTDGVGGVGVWSRYPIRDVRRIPDPSDRSRSTSIVTLDVDGRALQVVPLHLISPCPTCGASVLERLEFEDVTRQAEAGAVLDALDPSVPAIVGGDLNSTERSTPYLSLIRGGFEDPHRAAGWGPGFTWPAHGPLPALLRIDWLLTRDLRAVAAEVGDGHGSDHRPVSVELAWEQDDDESSE